MAFSQVSKKFLNLKSPSLHWHARGLAMLGIAEILFRGKKFFFQGLTLKCSQGPRSIQDEKFSRQNLTVRCHDKVISA